MAFSGSWSLGKRYMAPCGGGEEGASCQPKNADRKVATKTPTTHLSLLARHALKLVEPLAHKQTPVLECILDALRLLLPKFIALPALLWRPHKAVHADLARDGRAQVDARHLVDLRKDTFINVDKLEEASSTAALARVALGDGVE